jgi:hypothetical protein
MMKKTIGQLATLMAFLSFTQVVEAQNQLTVNPGFETGRKGWYYDAKDGIADLVSDQPHSGAAALKLSSAEGKGVKFFYTRPEEQGLSFKAGKSYHLKAWVKVLAPTRHIDLRIYSTTGFKEGQDIEVSVKGKGLKLNEWQQITFEFKGSNYDKGKFAIGINLGEVIFDDIELVEL